MKRFALIIMTIATIFAQQVHAQYYSVNFDAKTVAATVPEPLQKRIMTSRCRIY